MSGLHAAADVVAKKEELLKSLWLQPKSPASFSSPYRLYKEAKKQKINVTVKEVKKFLQSLKTYTVHRFVKIRFPRASLIAYSIDYSWQVDVAYMTKFWRRNSGYRFLLSKL